MTPVKERLERLVEFHNDCPKFNNGDYNMIQCKDVIHDMGRREGFVDGIKYALKAMEDNQDERT